MSNPYSVYFDWLYDGADSELPNIVLENKYKFSVHYLLNLFMSNHKVCRYANKYLNNFYCIGLSFEEFSKTIKFIIQNFNIRKSELFHSKFIHQQKDKEIYKIMKRFPYLKYGDIALLYDDFKKYYDDSYTKKIIKKREKTKTKIKFDEIMEEFRNIKSKCGECALKNQPMCLFDTNSKSNILNVDIMFIGEAPGAEEAKTGKPFVGRSGKLLRKYIKNYIIKNKIKYFIANSVLCRPPNNKIDQSYVKSCSKNLERIIEIVKPKLLVAVGATTMRRLGCNEKISKFHGNTFKYRNLPCFVLIHPAALLRNTFSESVYEQDFDKIIKFLKGE